MRSPVVELLKGVGLAAGFAALACSSNPPDAPIVASTPPIEPIAKPIDTVPLHGQLAFVGVDARIHLMNADGSGDTQITQGPSADPAWSPDGTRLAFVGDSGIYLMNADGSGVARLIAGGSEPAWSPDGRRIVFAMDSADTDTTRTRRIALVNVDGSGFTWLSSGTYDFSPAWSPDGRRIAFVRNGDDITPSLIYAMVPEAPYAATALTFLPPGSLCASSSPAWAPDGKVLLFWSFCAGGFPPSFNEGMGFALGNSDGTGGMTAVRSSVAQSYYSKPAWSPDGKFIAFASPGFGVPVGDEIVYIIRRDGSNAIRLSPGTRPAWRPGR